MGLSKQPEGTFQGHVADYLNRHHGYAVLEQSEITDTEHFLAEDQLWAFLQATQKETLDKLAADYGTDACEEVFRALRDELRHTPLWMLLRHGLTVRGLDLRLYYPKPRSSESVANAGYKENRLTSRHHFYSGETGKGIDFVVTDRRALDKNLTDEIENFSHLKDVVGLADKSTDLLDLLRERKSIIVTTQQKIQWLLDTLQQHEALHKLRVAFLIDEAHRSLEGKAAIAIRVPFRNSEAPDEDVLQEHEVERL